MRVTKLYLPFFLEISCYFFVLSIALYQRDFLIYRDFSIIWHGGLLVADGYSPFKDFVMPISPISVYLTGFFMILTEKSWLAFQMSQLVLNFFLLVLATVFLVKFEKNDLVIRVSLLFFTSLYLLLLTHPWYNNFGAFFLLTSILLANYSSKKLILLCGITSGLAIFSKLDFGILACSASIAIICYRSMLGSKKALFKKIFLFCAGLIALSTFFIFQYQDIILQQTIEIYKEVAASRSNRFSRILDLKIIFLVSVGLWCIFYPARHAKHFFSYGLIILSAAATSILGGIEHTHYYFIFTIPALLFFCYQNQGFRRHLFFLVPMVIFLIAPMARPIIHIAENIATNSYEPEFFNHRNISKNAEIINLSSCSESLKNIYGPKDFCQILDIVEKNIGINDSKNKTMLNITELGFLNALMNLTPRKEHPIWYKSGQTITAQLEVNLHSEMVGRENSLILIQNIPWQYSSSMERKKMVQLVKNNSNYYQIEDIYKSPMCMLGNFELSECGINIFVLRANAGESS